ncbi:MAG TPA: hypothetical protein VKE40_18765 [Gemmataceae bacterium]|nr:hypothetical protein [Gemmataceae bacterium]
MNAGLLSLALLVGQPVHPAVPPPALPASPFLFVTVSAPPGSQVTWYPMTDQATNTDKAVGLRPGYPYRFQLSDVPGPRGTVLFPSIEVRGSLVPRPGLDVLKHPVPILFTERDIDRALDGRLVTKVYYLEDPDQAVPVAGTPGEALESAAVSEDDAIKEARARGRMMLIVRLGERPYTKEELAYENVPGTILFPDAKATPIPAAPPRLPFAGVIVYDPIIGAKGAGEECLKDGGDTGPRLGPGPYGTIGGLNPSDTAMQFTTPRGTKTVPSNRVCICVPRFASARVEVGPTGHHIIRAPEGVELIKPVSSLVARKGPGESRNFEQLQAAIGSKRASGTEGVISPVTLNVFAGKLAGLASIKGVAALAQVRGPEEINSFPGCVLLLQKSINPPNPEKLGEVLTVTLKYTNPTTEVMTDVVIADSLTARLEYVEGSAKSSRAATFTAENNEAGSSVLKWSIDGKLQPGESGTITFQVRIK